MPQQQDTKSELRAAYTKRGLKNAKYCFPTGSIGMFMRVTLAVIYMYLIVISYLLMGSMGLVLVSTLFLIALFSPIIYQLGRRFLRIPGAFTAERNEILEREAEQEG